MKSGTRPGASPAPSRVTSGRLAALQQDVLDVARAGNYQGYSKHDALNAPWLEALAGDSRLLRLLFIQLVTRCPLHIRPVLGVRRAANPKGIALFARAQLARYRVLGDQQGATEGRALLDWLLDHPADGFPWACWGYPYPWQDAGFFAPRHSPNRVVTSFVIQALLDGYETLNHEPYLDAAGGAVRFLLDAPKSLYEDARHRCVSYVPSSVINWIVLDVSALAGAAVARYAAIRGERDLLGEAGRLVRYVASKQTPYGAWYYAEPPSASHITHDNYHTGFILDSLLVYGECAASDEFDDVYRRGLRFYRDFLFQPSGAPRYRHDRTYPFDIHGAAQGIVSFALAHRATGEGREMSRSVLRWAIEDMYQPRTRWFAYQRHRLFRTRIPLLRWCQAWMAWAIACHLEHCGEW